eukprot:274542-Chlamydomonas_euryale.AAC.1
MLPNQAGQKLWAVQCMTLSWVTPWYDRQLSTGGRTTIDTCWAQPNEHHKTEGSSAKRNQDLHVQSDWQHVPIQPALAVYVVLQLWTARPPLAESIRRGQPARTPPQRPPGAQRKGRHKGRKQFSKPDYTGEGRRKCHITVD